MPRLHVIVASTRPGRVGRAVGEWFAAAAEDHGGFEVELVDLADVALPFLDEPKHPRLRQYEHEHTRRWSATVDRADAFAFVMPEYNHGFSAPLKNAIDFLWHEWNDKPVVLVPYGGVSGGTRAANLLRPVLAAVRLVPAAEVPIPFVHQRLVDGRIEPNVPMEEGARAALDELVRVAGLLGRARSAAEV